MKTERPHASPKGRNQPVEKPKATKPAKKPAPPKGCKADKTGIRGCGCPACFEILTGDAPKCYTV